MTLVDVQHTGSPSRSETKALQTPETGSSDSIMSMLTGDEPPSRGRDALLAAYYASPMLRSAVRVSAQSIAQNEWDFFSGDDALSEDHPARVLWDRPNVEMFGTAYREFQESCFELLGEKFAIPMASDRTDGPSIELWPVPPTWMERRDGTWEMTLPDGDRLEFGLDEVFWSKDLNLENPMGRGKGAGRTLEDEVEADEYAAKFNKQYFYNSARPDFMLFLPGASEDRVKRFKRQWRSRYAGHDRHHTPAVLSKSTDGVSPEVVEMTAKFKDLETSDFRRAEQKIIRQTIGVPPELVGDTDDANRATIETAEVILARRKTRPALSRMKQEWNHEILPMIGDGLRADFHDPEPDDKEHTRAVMKEHPYAFMVNEIREEAGKPPVPDGDVFLRETGRFEEVRSERSTHVVPASFEVEAPDQKSDILLLETYKQGDGLSTMASPQELAERLEAVDVEAEMTEAREKYRDEVETWAQGELATYGASESFSKMNPLIDKFVEDKTGDLITSIDDTTKERIRGAIDDGFREGLGPRAVVQQADETFEQFGKGRSLTIARTEMNKASNWGIWQAQKVSGLVPARQWVATFDGRTRSEHIGLHGEKVGIDEAFRAAGDTAMYPGGFADPALSINCRCTTVPWIDEYSPALEQFPEDLKIIATTDLKEHEAPALVVDHYKSYDHRLMQSEERFAVVMRQYFEAQRRGFITQLEQVLGVEVAA